MWVRRPRATSAGISPRWTASCRADSVWERRSVGARSLCAPGTSTPALARWRTALASTTNLVIGYLRSEQERHNTTVARNPARSGDIHDAGSGRRSLGVAVRLGSRCEDL